MYYHTIYKDTDENLATIYPNKAVEIAPYVLESRVWVFFTDAARNNEVSRFHEMMGWQLIPPSEWRARADLLCETFNAFEWRAILAMDAKYCSIRNKLTQEAQESRNEQ